MVLMFITDFWIKYMQFYRFEYFYVKLNIFEYSPMRILLTILIWETPTIYIINNFLVTDIPCFP